MVMDFEAMMRQMGRGGEGGLPMPSSFPSPEEVAAKARNFSKQLFADYDTLRMIVERHEATIRKRWSKKSNVQKKKILLESWPDMSAQHRPDVQAWKRKSRAKEPFLWPSINLEDLVKTRNMLIFLYARGRHQPHEFVHADVEQTKFGERTGVTMPAFLNEYTMYFHDRTKPITYGELVSWDDDEDAFENMTNGVGMHPGDGLHALEIQQRILSFLVKFCQLLLRDISPLTESDVLPDPGPPADVLKEAGITSLEVTSMEAQYAVPSRLDFTRLKAMLAAERNAREDHAWALREDPLYFADILQDFADHRQEVILDTKGHKHPTLTEPGQPLFWNRVLGNVVWEALFGLATFDEIFKQVQALEVLYAKYRNALRPENDLPVDLMRAFQNMRFMLQANVKNFVQSIRVGILASPPMRGFCYREPQDPNTTKMQAVFEPHKGTKAAKDVMALLNNLFNEHELSQISLHALTDEFDRLMRNDAEASSLISPFIASRLSSLSVIAECLHQLHLFQPWARKIEDDLDQNQKRAMSHYQQTFSKWAPIMAVSFERSRVCQYADPSDGKFDYPIHRRRNKENIEKLRSAEASLDAFWDAVDRHYQAATKGKTYQELVANMLSSDREIQRTAPWTEPEKKAKPGQDDNYIYQPFSSIIHEPTTKITDTFDRTSVSTKPTKSKTRGPAAPATADNAIPHTTDPALREQRYTVDKRAHKVFKALFHAPHNPDLPGEVPWLDFVNAMVYMGFVAEKANGSAWNFFPRTIDLGVERSIQFHEPHPEKKIPFRMARRFGRRLARAYGWDGRMFVLG